MSDAIKPPTNRTGRTHKVKVGKVSMYVTVNRAANGQIIEAFGKADEGVQGHLDVACRLISLAIQGRGDMATIIRHLRFDRTPPNGGPGQPTSIYDALARVLEDELTDTIPSDTMRP